MLSRRFISSPSYVANSYLTIKFATTTTTSTTTISTSSSFLFTQQRSFFHSSALLLINKKKSRNPYKILGIPQGASEKDIKKAYRVMAMKFHPDSPGGSHEKFQEVQEAYEQIKTGVWIPAAGSDVEGANAVKSRFGSFKYKTASKSNVSFEEFMRDLHRAEQGKAPSGGNADPDPATAGGAAAGGGGGADGAGAETEVGPDGKPIPKKKPRINPQDIRIAAWFRLLSLWAVVFLSLRFAMLLIFPPKVEKKQKPNAPVVRQKREPPPPVRGGQQQQGHALQ